MYTHIYLCICILVLIPFLQRLNMCLDKLKTAHLNKKIYMNYMSLNKSRINASKISLHE